MNEDFGVLTLATKKDYVKAIAMAYSFRISNPGIPICIVCSKEIAEEVKNYFDHIVIERNDIKGFAHKIFLDQYSPFKKTFFIDADMLVYKNILPMIKDWGEKRYAAGGIIRTGGISSFGLDRQYVLEKIGKEEFSAICGAGHAYFEKPQCQEVFDLGRKIMENYHDYANPCRFADEDVMGIALTILGIKPMNSTGYFGMPCHAIKYSFKSDVKNQKCSYIDGKHGKTSPVAVHFAAMQTPFIYAREQQKILHKNKINVKGIWKIALKDAFTTKIFWPISTLRKKIMSKPL